MRCALIVLALALAAAPALAQPGTSSPTQPAASAAQKPWWERLELYGDLRLRYEGFFQDDRDTRQRGRYRFRFGLRTEVSEGLDLNLRLASGETGDVTSTNQSLSDFLSRKPINIDRISLTYTPPRARALTLAAGKFAPPVTRTQMVWDDDVNWEGAYEQVAFTAGAADIRLVAVQAPLNDVAGPDAFMFGHYGHAAVDVGAHAVQVSLASYTFQNPDQLAIALDEAVEIRTAQTNAVRRDAAGRVIGYASGFHLVDTIVEATVSTGREEYPLVALANVVANTRAAGDDNTGVWLSGSYGLAERLHTFALSYTFARVERDAVVSAYNFSDMGPATNVLMNMATFAYVPKDRLTLEMTAIFTRHLSVVGAAANPTLTRIQVDARVTF